MATAKRLAGRGVDIGQNGYGRAFVLDYLAIIAPERMAATATLFDALAIEEEKSPRRNDAASEATLLQLAPQMQELVDFLTAHQQGLANGSSSAKAEQALRFSRVMQQWLITQVALLRPSGWDRGDARTNYMGQNLRAWIEAADPDAKIIAWAYNSHLTSIIQEDEGPQMGSIMREIFGERYYAIGFEFNQGSFQNRILLPSNYLGDLLAITLPPSPPHTLGWYLAQVGQPLFFLEFRNAGNPLVTAWLGQTQVLHSGGWVINPADEENLRREVLRGYDAFIFVDSTTPSRPTPNALRRVANREGL